MILFLDFDGVMHPYGCPNDRFFCQRELLESWLRQRPSVDVVISSTWRETRTLDEMRLMFTDDLRPRIIGVTPVLGREEWAEHDGMPPPTRFERELEVARWLHASGEPWRIWAALDDSAWLYKPFSHGLVVCDGTVGLTQRDLDLVDGILGVRR